MHVFGPSAEPQDVAPLLRHYEMMRIQMECGDKLSFMHARRAHNEMISAATKWARRHFDDDVWCFTSSTQIPTPA
jgi:hypothetical protein